MVKNGTTAEKCFPYASSDGKYIPTCPKQCLNESHQFKKYFAKNTYALEPVKTSPDLYDIIAIIMDELITYDGPMYSALRIFKDFMELHKNATKCAETIYHHDGNFEDESGHAVTLVGYGFENNKYYWLMQNSLGENDCDHGFFKIEFGQINAEKVSFSEPYIEDETIITKKIVLDGNGHYSCRFSMNTNITNLEDWKSPLYLKFKHQNENSTYNAYWGIYSFQKQSKGISCYYDQNNLYYQHKGYYVFDRVESLGKENEFEVAEKIKNLKFLYLGLDDIQPLSSINKIYISEEGSRFSFKYIPLGQISVPSILSNGHKQKILKCNISEIGKLYVGYCDIRYEDLDYFYDEGSNEYGIALLIKCIQYKESNIIVQKLDKSIHPVFKINNFVINEKETEEKKYISASLIVNIDGGLSDFKGTNKFIMPLYLNKEGQNITLEIKCDIGHPIEVHSDYILSFLYY